MTNKENGFEMLEEGQIISVEWKQVIAGAKTKFKMKIRGGKRKVKQGKIKEDLNKRFGIHYNIKSSKLICTNLQDT